MLEMPHCNADTFQIFLNEFSLHNPEELKIMVLDNGAFHKAKKITIPENIVLVFLPPYSPELNPAEKMWAKFKRTFTNRLFYNLDDLSIFICEVTKALNNNEVKSICAFSYIFLDHFWTKY